MPSPVRSPLTEAAVDTERHVARMSWDQPPRLFALVNNAALVAREPSLSEQLGQADPAGFSAIEQEGLDFSLTLEAMLAQLAWPDEVDGVALAVERIVVPPEAEHDLPEDQDQAMSILTEHPDRKDIRVLVAVLRGDDSAPGESVCLIRQRDHDSDDAVAIGADLAPGLVHALRASLQ